MEVQLNNGSSAGASALETDLFVKGKSLFFLLGDGKA
jgi:hypothetical protein